MAKIININIDDLILGSGIDEWESEGPQPGTNQIARYTYETQISDARIKVQLYICPAPFAEDKTKHLVNLSVLSDPNLAFTVAPMEYKVDLSGAHSDLESWPQTGDDVRSKIAEIVSNTC